MIEYRNSRSKKQRQNIILLSIFAVLLIIFLFTFGFNLLINTTLFIANLTNNSNKSQVNKNDEFVLAPELFSLSDATSSAQLVINGTAQKNSKLSFYVNGQKQKEIIIDADTFEDELTLQKGQNEIYVQMDIAKDTISKKSDTYHIVYLDQKPRLELAFPSDGFRTNKSDITVSGSTDSGVSIRVNGSPVTLSSDSKFNQTLQLSDGENKIVITATDQAGNTETKELTITLERD
ncbi:hypothetical protein A3D80_04575 [Candidatus Roizmanbacteria bacterium RIFCSPHIGHO2_02_FULL_40_13b]|uniref:Uncharacterized protein n=1 Tax=Candidatus Roizmanbacteria bacterium RIFCSPHIGHO2_01_FULL_39_24 TaxID=1802032 RepID=A0A1F7GFA2_9BACT|nr:MAG: hypothetical protein A2799_04025 [Candidatus Roizmanbacteria bacterium RIFCSPHIGHO2_01_FULL_39_24]OGK26435.1 MAG: hypothetical protein A3D80_04575 [Candidatus Roizmanbacteria bacterium RIFCSPHIGHO2_02_FULL_40_13b]OGK49376.1 MAG: hypothetical protein A3A56_02510 [Candidatus Roizmanbacteria bacterium RIFCSPLOWO2_01_FULL_40_32]OGK57533.1 MAG: hypothetical protein A3H83_03185 [Candidatus Roizmanbacteria bacterium RIFCSPLOWO2_02_FULL_39_8]